jgi:hypothetical protein
MIGLPRRKAGRFRALARRCVVGRPRGPAPPVFLRKSNDELTLSASFGEVSLSLRIPASSTASSGDAEVATAIPMALLEAAEESGSDSALIEIDPSGKVRCRFTQQGESCEAVFEVPVADAPALSNAVRRPRMRPVGDGLLAALYEAGRTTPRAFGSLFPGCN